jgi:peptidoglycan/xylan/chitin deacetylase (PgdA/CDA1 family)
VRRALGVVPMLVKLRITVVTVALLYLLLHFAYSLRGLPAVLVCVLLPLFALAGYVAWCVWPRLRWGLSSLLLDPPLPPGQPLRISFDDGPTPGLTEPILDLLAQHGIKASFFVLLPKARRCRRILRRIVAEGHVLGLHGEDHRAPFFRPAAELSASLRRARRELETIVDAPLSVTLYRPSHGWKNRALVEALGSTGLRMTLWDHGVWDTDAPSTETLLSRLRVVSKDLDPGQPLTLLLHDGRGDPFERPPHADALLSALAVWLPELKRTHGGAQSLS